jgi:hypothetical protein
MSKRNTPLPVGSSLIILHKGHSIPGAVRIQIVDASASPQYSLQCSVEIHLTDPRVIIPQGKHYIRGTRIAPVSADIEC